MERMLVGVFDTKDQMDAACRDLQESGIPNDRVHVHSGTAQETLGGTEFAKSDDDQRGTGFFDRLFGRVPEGDRHARLYSEAVRRGGFVVVIDGIDEDRVDEAVQLLERDGAYDVDERATKWRESGWHDDEWEKRRDAGEAAATGTMLEGQRAADLTAPAAGVGMANAPGGIVNAPEIGDANLVGRQDMQGREEGMTIPVVEEQLNIGKREVQRGGVRIFSRMTERPVEENVQLREEHARVERRPVDRPATEAELGKAFKEKSVELRETVEEPVVAKTARVVEEVDIAKDVETRTETVRDTVRRTDVEVEQLPDDLPGARVTKPADGKRPPGRR